jgi:hypothetical protein
VLRERPSFGEFVKGVKATMKEDSKRDSATSIAGAGQDFTEWARGGGEIIRKWGGRHKE